MTKKKALLIERVELRRKAEERLQAKTVDFDLSPNMEGTKRLVHELEVHQVELEMQNEELLQARDEAGAALKKYTDLYDLAPTGYFSLDSIGTILAVNISGASLLGVDRSRLVGRRFGLFVADNERLFFSEFLENVFASQSKQSGEVTLTREESSPLIVQIEAIAEARGNECSIVLIDITERRLLEEENERLNVNLTARAAELEVANQELEAFNYTVAHDLRQPLNVVGSYCQVIMELCGENLDANCNRYLRRAYEGTLRMNQLIEALLDFSRFGNVEPEREKVDLSALAHEVVSTLKLTGPERKVDFQIACGITANADANLLRVVLENLLGNAWKYTGMREAAVIEFSATEINGKPVFSVRDNGTGFDMADADKLFVPFQRLPDAEECRGFGIGLATVARIVKRHGGRVWAEGELGKGATFWFTVG